MKDRPVHLSWDMDFVRSLRCARRLHAELGGFTAREGLGRLSGGPLD